MRRIIQAIITAVLRRSFEMWQALGVHVTSNYFESPIPDTRCLNEEIWSKRSNLTGIDMRKKGQVRSNCLKRSHILIRLITSAFHAVKLAPLISILLTTGFLKRSMA